ncbi:MAG: beta-mannosidase [Ruminococcus sp.]|nr:beta-mannosidase [Ruminococcus sp.]
MKRFISAAMVAAMALSQLPLQAAAAGNVYELENGTIYDTGDNVTKVVAMNGASGGKVVDLKDAGDSVTISVNAASAGMYKQTLRYSQPFDKNGKKQNVLINGTNIGQIQCSYTEKDSFAEVSTSAYLKKGENEITIQGSWGWTYLDSLTIEESGTSTANINKTLSNPNASAQARSLYSFLCDTYGDHIISGQQESTWMGSENYEFDIIKNASGRYPALRGLDYMGDDFSGCNRRAKAWYQKGGIVTICWHCGSDFSGSHSEALAADLDWNKALTPGTSEYNKLVAGMDKGAKALLELKQAGVPVIWRPFHEFDGKWFWWGKGGAENFKKLWRIMYDRYTNYWGLDNLIWNLGYSGDVNDGWYPGDAYVDIIGADTYVDNTSSLVGIYHKTAQVSNKPVCLHENGPIPDPDNLTSEGSKWLWFMTWHTSFIDSHAINTSSYVDHVYNSDYVLTLDELPDVYNYTSADITPSQPVLPEAPVVYSAGHPNNIISRNVAAYSDAGNASDGNDSYYYTEWSANAPAYLAYDLSGVSASQRKQVIAAWYNTGTFDNIGSYINKSNEPVDYTIEVNAAAGGSYPKDGWVTAAAVSDNHYSSRQHYIDMQGYNWIRLNVKKPNGGSVRLNFDVHNASDGVSDSWLFLGDSITAGSMVNCYGTSYAEFINRIDPDYYPVQQNGGIGGTVSSDGRNAIDEWLSGNPAKYVSIAYGTNDAWGNPNNAQKYYDNVKYMIDAVIAAGKTPVLPKIPYATNNDVGANTGNYNAMIDKLYQEYGDKLVHGPDFDKFFRENPSLLSGDGVHPSFDGYEAMRKLWAETMYANVYTKTQTSVKTYPDPILVSYSSKYHQIRFEWDAVENAQNYGIAVYLAGKWRIQTQSISASATSYTTPKNLTPDKTYKVAIAAKVGGKWDIANAIKNAVTVTVK